MRKIKTSITRDQIVAVTAYIADWTNADELSNCEITNKSTGEQITIDDLMSAMALVALNSLPEEGFTDVELEVADNE